MAALVGPPFDADQSFLAAWMRSATQPLLFVFVFGGAIYKIENYSGHSLARQSAQVLDIDGAAMDDSAGSVHSVKHLGHCHQRVRPRVIKTEARI